MIYPFGLKGIFYYSAFAVNMGRTCLEPPFFRCVLCFDLIAPDCVIPICHACSHPTFEVIDGAVEVKLTARQIRKRKQHPAKRLRDLLLSKLAPILSSELMQGKQKKSYNSTAKWFYRRRLRGPSPGLPFPPRPRQQHSNSCKHRQTECMSPWLFKWCRVTSSCVGIICISNRTWAKESRLPWAVDLELWIFAIQFPRIC